LREGQKKTLVFGFEEKTVPSSALKKKYGNKKFFFWEREAQKQPNRPGRKDRKTGNGLPEEGPKRTPIRLPQVWAHSNNERRRTKKRKGGERRRRRGGKKHQEQGVPRLGVSMPSIRGKKEFQT